MAFISFVSSSKCAFSGSILGGDRHAIVAADTVVRVMSKEDGLHVRSGDLPWPKEPDYDSYDGLLIDSGGRWR